MTRACAWGGCSRAFESNATRDAKKLGLMPFEIARKGHRITAPCQECGVGVVSFVFFEEKRILRRKRTGMPDHTRDSRRARQGKGKALQNLNGQGPCAAGIRKGCPEGQPPPLAAGASAISLRNA
jgi:hypothetical protein